MAIDFPARHDKSSLNCRRSILLCGTPPSTTSVAAEAVALVGIFMPPSAMFVGQSEDITYRF